MIVLCNLSRTFKRLCWPRLGGAIFVQICDREQWTTLCRLMIMFAFISVSVYGYCHINSRHLALKPDYSLGLSITSSEWFIAFPQQSPGYSQATSHYICTRQSALWVSPTHRKPVELLIGAKWTCRPPASSQLSLPSGWLLVRVVTMVRLVFCGIFILDVCHSLWSYGQHTLGALITNLLTYNNVCMLVVFHKASIVAW